jgi:hypothetical protein
LNRFAVNNKIDVAFIFERSKRTDPQFFHQKEFIMAISDESTLKPKNIENDKI